MDAWGPVHGASRVSVRVTLFAEVRYIKYSHLHVKMNCVTPEASSLYYGNNEASLCHMRCGVVKERFS
jgi:hypothetical protein